MAALLDIDEIRKLSMFSDKIDVLKTYHHKYKEAIAIIFGKGTNKSIRLCFKKSYCKSNDDMKRDKNILSVANNVSLYQDKKEIQIKELCSNIKETVVKNGYFLNVYANEASFYHKESHIQALILCSIAMMNETSPKKPVDLYVSRSNDSLEIKIIVRIETEQEARGVQGVEEIVPWSTLRIALIDSICDKNNISYSISVVQRQLKVTFKVQQLKKEASSLHAYTLDASMLQEFYSLLAPREDIAIKYDIQGEGQEE